MDTQKHLEVISYIFSVFEDKSDIADLLLDVCTKKELEDIYQRFVVAQMLKDGLSFAQIEKMTGISSTTITRVNKCLKNGQGYNKMFDKYHLTIEYGD